MQPSDSYDLAPLDEPAKRRGILVLDNAGSIAFPPVCPRCSAPAQTTLDLERVFTIQEDDGESHRTVRYVTRYRAPFCAPCAARHRSEQLPASPWLPLRRLLVGDGSNLGGLIICGVGFFFTVEALKTLSGFLFAFSLLPWTVGGFLVRQTWKANRYMAVAPPTSVTSAIEFTHILSKGYEPPWREFRFRDPAYAERFEQANAGRLWDPQGDVARAAHEKRKRRGAWAQIAGFTVLGLGGAWMLWDEFLSPLWQWIQRQLEP